MPINKTWWARPLSQTPIPTPMPDDVVAAATLAVITNDDDPFIILTKRASHLKKHAGQISFPGGRVDASDTSLIHTSLREAEEEISLLADSLEIAGFLPDMLTGTGYRITPVVATSSASKSQLQDQLIADAGEVEAILYLPLSLALDKNAYDQFTRQDKGTKWRSWRLHHEDHIIWGATAAILHQWANALS